MTWPPGDTALIARTNAGLKIKKPGGAVGVVLHYLAVEHDDAHHMDVHFQRRRHPGCPETLRSYLRRGVVTHRYAPGRYRIPRAGRDHRFVGSVGVGHAPFDDRDPVEVGPHTIGAADALDRTARPPLRSGAPSASTGMIAGEIRAATRFTSGRRAIVATELGPKETGAEPVGQTETVRSEGFVLARNMA